MSGKCHDGVYFAYADASSAASLRESQVVADSVFGVTATPLGW